MILRKPYAILIKNFRLIHAILAVCMGYLFFRTNNIMSFIGEYLNSSQTTITSEVVNSLFSPLFFLIIVVIVIGTIIIMSLLKFKDKPVKIYIYNIIIYLASAIVYFVSYNIIRQLEIGLVDVRTLKLVQDFVTAIMMAQASSVIFVIIRTTGFDIKSFNFKEDLEDLNIEEKDNEEFEVELDVDTDKVKRRIRKSARYTKYVYVENKLLINIVAVILIIILGSLMALNLSVYNRSFNKNQSFKTNEFLINVTNSYLTNQDYYGNVIDEDKQYVIVKFKINKLYGNDVKLKTGRISLDIGNNRYYNSIDKKDKFLDLGNTYLSENITKDEKTYLLLFEIPANTSYKKMILRYTDTDNNEIKIDVTPTNLKNKKEQGVTLLNEELLLEKSTLGKSIFVINNYEFSEKFKVDYNYCIDDECYDSYEYVVPSNTDNVDKVLMKINGSLTLDENLGIRSLTMPKFLNYFATIKYIKGETAKLIKVDFKEIKPKKVKLNNEYYVEIPKYIIDADKIDLQLNIRNSVYAYHLK